MKSKPLPPSILLWIALTLTVLVIFLFNKKTIERVLEVTGFVETVKENWEIKEPELHPTYLEDSTYNPELEIPDEESESMTINEEVEPVEIPEEPIVEKRLRPTKLYFVKVTGDGQILLNAVNRGVPVGDSPLTSALQALLKGTNTEETNTGLTGMIPAGSELLSVRINNGIASLNFNEEFQFNQIGIEGYTAQLKQVIYTATEFPTIQSVQILIEGKRLPYLGAEGLYIGEPLSREVFE